MTDETLPINLGGGLTLRAATPADVEPLAAFNGMVHAASSGEPDAGAAAWTRDLLQRPHPTFRPDLFTVVEDRATGAIVSSLNLIPQTWSYGGHEFGVGRVELVGTHADYRRRGLVRHQMEIAHRWSAEQGHLLQGITGIPWYYRQFGYEMTLPLGGGHRVPASDIPAAADGTTDPYRLLTATPADVPFLTSTDHDGRRRSLVSCVRDEACWRYELEQFGDDEQNEDRVVVSIIESVEGTGDEGVARPVGFVASLRRLWNGTFWIRACEIAPGVSWLDVAPSLLRALQTMGTTAAAATPKEGDQPVRLERLGLDLGTGHPLYQVLPDRARDVERPYAWYIRIPDLPAFVRCIAPLLEVRLAASPAVGYSGDLRLNFYRDGLRLTFAGGRLDEVAEWPEADRADAGASFPPLTFLHLLLGYRSLADLEYLCADCRAGEEARVLLEILFPTAPSFIWPLS